MIRKVSKPHTESEWHERKREAASQVLRRSLNTESAEPATRRRKHSGNDQQAANIHHSHNRNDRTEFQASVPVMHPHHDRLGHSGCIHKCAEYQDQYQGGDIRAPVQPSDSRGVTILAQALSRQCAQDTDVLLRASLHAVEAKRTVEIPQLLRLKQL